jgi:hypothetical protein
VLPQKLDLIKDHELISKHKKNHPKDLDFHVPEMSISDTKLKLDSILFVMDSYFYKEIFTYNSNGSLLADLWQYYNNEAWFNALIFTYTYDEYGNRLTRLRQVPVDDTNWISSSLFTHTYGVNNNEQSILYQTWKDNAWLNDSFITYTYDANDNKQTEKTQKWEDNLWTNYRLNSYSYDNNGNCLTYLVQHWQNNAWGNSSMHDYTFDGSGNLTTDLDKGWNDNNWENMWIYNYTYDNNGNKLRLFEERWINGEWVNLLIYTYTYDQNNNRTIELNQRWANNEWTNYTKKEFAFNGKVVNATALEWKDSYWDESSENQDLEVILGGYNLYIIWARTAEFYYSDITGVESNELDLYNFPLDCYPNPALNKINIKVDIDQYSSNTILGLYNQYGQKIKSIYIEPSQIWTNISFSLEELPSGIYFIRLDNGMQIITQKIIHAK